MDEILGTPIWQISEARIHESREVQAPQKAIEWIQEIMEGDDIGKVRIEAKTRDIIPIYIQGWDTYKWAWLEYNRKDKTWIHGGMQKYLPTYVMATVTILDMHRCKTYFLQVLQSL